MIGQKKLIQQLTGLQQLFAEPAVLEMRKRGGAGEEEEELMLTLGFGGSAALRASKMCIAL